MTAATSADYEQDKINLKEEVDMAAKVLDMKKNVIATALVFSIFVKGEIYYQIVVEKLKEQ